MKNKKRKNIMLHGRVYYRINPAEAWTDSKSLNNDFIKNKSI